MSHRHLLPHEIAHVPRVPVESFAATRLVIRPRDRAHDLAIHQQVDARLPFVLAAADQKANELPLDREFGGSQRAG